MKEQVTKLIDLSEACVLTIHQLLDTLDKISEAGKLEPFPRPPMNELERVLTECGGKVYRKPEDYKGDIS